MASRSGMTLIMVLTMILNVSGSNIFFEQNKNQWPARVKFQADIPGGKLFLENNCFTYLYIEEKDWHKEYMNESAGPVTVKNHAYRVFFENSNTATELNGNNRLSWHRNYYLGKDPANWASNVPVFTEVNYSNLYDHINARIYQDGGNLKYDLILTPGADPSQIKLRYEGVDALYIENGNLFIKTSVYDLKETQPYAYQVINGKEVEVQCKYVLAGNKLSFSLGNYEPDFALIIDPTLVASTCSGSATSNRGFAATYDNAGNMYMAGTCGGAGYPYTTGAWDATYNGGLPPSPGQWPMDITISKFNPKGTALLYSTYYGGSANEQPNSLIVNGKGELYVLGRTNSTNFPFTGGAYDATHNGGYDVIIGRFNTVGNLLSSTYVGGTLDDNVNYSIAWTGAGSFGATKFNFGDDGRCDLTLDTLGNVYVVGSTRSTDFPTTIGVPGSVFGGTQDAYVLKMDSTLSTLLFSTYLGGTGTDAAYSVNLDNYNNVVVAGGTTGGGYPTTVGTLNPAYQGGNCDGFISVFKNDGSAILRSTFIGTNAYDQVYFTAINQSNEIFIYGQSQGNYPITQGLYSNPSSAMFIEKLNGNLTSSIYSTVVGNGSLPSVSLSPTAFGIDSCENIFIAGYGRSSILSANMPSPGTTTGLPITTDALQNSTDGKDFYIARFSPDMKSLTYGTFFGEGAANPDADHIHDGVNRFDSNGILYHAACASCGGSSSFPSTPGAVCSGNPTSVPTSDCIEYVFKMDLAYHPFAGGGITGAVNNLCAPATLCFGTMGPGVTCSSGVWDFGDGSIGNGFNPCYTYNSPGTFTIAFYCFDSLGSCTYLDTLQTTITVNNCTSVHEYSEGEDIIITPNPANHEISISGLKVNSNIYCTNTLGEIIELKKIGSSEAKFDISSFPPGLYLLHVRNEDGYFVRKLIKE